jgi:cytochrome c5
MKHVVFGVALLGMLLSVGPVAAADGKAVYDKSCGGCHNNMAPKVGDKAAWAPRIQKGTDALVASAVKGIGAMPAKGGAASLSNDDIKAAVEYMVGRAK